MFEIDDRMTYEQKCTRLLEGLVSGVGDALFPLRPSAELVVAAGVWDENGAILILRLDDTDEDRNFILFDSYVV